MPGCQSRDGSVDDVTRVSEEQEFHVPSLRQKVQSADHELPGAHVHDACLAVVVCGNAKPASSSGPVPLLSGYAGPVHTAPNQIRW